MKMHGHPRGLFSLLLLCLFSMQLPSAEVVRFYTLGEDDGGAQIGKVALDTLDTVEFQETDAIGPTVDLLGFGTYVEGRDGAGSFAMGFDGITDFFEAERFDPRDFGGSFSALSQGWIKADAGGNGIRQQIWALGTDNGGVAITEDGFFELVSGGSAGSKVTTRSVDYGEWTHVAVRRTGNNGFLYVNGSLVDSNAGFWNAPGLMYLGSAVNGDEPYQGAIDDFIISGFGDGIFDLINDIKFFDPDSLSGVLGDVNQDGSVNGDDYDIWSTNNGFDNGLGLGDANTIFRGDVDQNGRVNFFDFQIIRNEAAAVGITIGVPEPEAGCLLLLLGLGSSLLFRRTSRRVY